MNLSKTLVAIGLWATTLLATAAMYTPIDSANSRTVVNNANLQNQNYKQLARPYYDESNNYIYALADDFISIFANTGDAGQLQVMQEKFTNPAINNTNQLQFLNIEPKNSVAILLRDASASGNPLTFFSRGFSDDSNKLGWQLQALKIKQKEAAVYNDNISAIAGYNLQFADFNGRHLYLTGSKNSKTKIFVLSNLTVNADGVTYENLIQSEDIADASSAIAASGENIYLLSQNKLSRFIWTDTKIIKQDEIANGINAATSLSVLTPANSNSDYIYIASNNLAPYAAENTAGLLLLEKRKQSSVMNFKDTLTSNQYPDIKLISDLYHTHNLMLAVSKQTSQIIFFKITNGLLEPIGKDALKTNSGAGDTVTAPTSVLLSSSAGYFYAVSNDVKSRSILRISRIADLSLEVERLQKKSQPGRTVDFRVSVKNNGSNDVPLVSLQLLSSHRISNINGANAQNCEVKDDKTSCNIDLIAAGKTQIYTFSMRPENRGTASLRVNLLSLHKLKNNKNSKTATIQIGDFNNGTLAISPYFLMLFSLLFVYRKYVKR